MTRHERKMLSLEKKLDKAYQRIWKAYEKRDKVNDEKVEYLLSRWGFKNQFHWCKNGEVGFQLPPNDNNIQDYYVDMDDVTFMLNYEKDYQWFLDWWTYEQIIREIPAYQFKYQDWEKVCKNSSFLMYNNPVKFIEKCNEADRKREEEFKRKQQEQQERNTIYR